eukprot:gene53501-73131_t
MKNEVKVHEVNPLGHHTNRRNFLKISGLTAAGVGLLLVGCSDDDDDNPTPSSSQLPGVRNGVFDLGGGDFGVLTYAYALEQLESDFYYKVVNASGFNSTFTDVESTVEATRINSTFHIRESTVEATRINSTFTDVERQLLTD